MSAKSRALLEAAGMVMIYLEAKFARRPRVSADASSESHTLTTNVELRRLIDQADAARVVFARSLLMRTLTAISRRAIATQLPGPYWARCLPGARTRFGRLHKNRLSAKREMSWSVRPVTARSARISPITGANLKPCPEHGAATMIRGDWGNRSRMKSPSGVMV